MAIMNKMREKMTVIFAGLAGAFLLMIVFEWGAQGDFFRSGPRPDEIGEVNGLSISNKEYQDTYQALRQQTMSEKKKTALDEAEEAEVSEKTWDQMLTQKILEQQLMEYGIAVSDQEVRDRLFYNPPEDLRRGFIDSTGRFHQKEYWDALRDPRNDTIVAPMTIRIREELKREKLQGVLISSIRLTNAEMWERYDIEHTKADIQVVKVAPGNETYSDFVKGVTDAEMQKYYDEHKFQYKADEARKVKFVVFREVPTAKDSAQAIDRVQTLMKRWRALPLSEPDSTLKELARDYTDAPFQEAKMLDPRALSGLTNGDTLLRSNVGDVIMVSSQGQVKVLRITAQTDSGEALYHLRTIFLPYKSSQNRDSLKAVADKFYSDIKNGADFASIAHEHSGDPSAKNGGDMGWVPLKSYFPEVMNAAVKAPQGELMGPIENSGGFHLFILEGKLTRKIIAQSIQIDIHPSSTTAKMAQQQANVFREKALKDGFDEAAKAMDLRVVSNVPPVTKKGQALFGYKPWVAYIFELSAGDITSAVRVSSNKMNVVAQLTEIVPKGYKPLDGEVKKQIQGIVARQKMVESVKQKADQLRAMLSPGDPLEKLATVDSNYRPIPVSMGPGESTRELGEEYNVNTAVYYQMKDGEISQPIKGTAAYYIVKRIGIRQADKKLFDLEKPKFFEALTKEKVENFFRHWLENLKDKAEIKDYRIGRS